MRKTILAAGGAALIAVLSACGQAPAPAPGPAPAPAEKQAEGLFTDARALVQASSAKAGQAASAKFTMDMTAAGQKMTGSGAMKFANGQNAGSMTMSVLGQTMEVRIVDNSTTYLKLPPEALKKLNTKKPWVKADEATMKTMLGDGSQTDQSDPRKTLEVIQESGTITKGVPEKLDGQDTFHYSVQLDPAKMQKQFPGGQSAAEFAKIKDKIGKIPMELWLNGDQLPVKITMDLGETVKAGALAAGATPEQLNSIDIGGLMTTRYSDWGTADVAVQAPPADEVGELPKR
ncbi:hypothetical protein [Amycolatopsis minnesotensis]|uniref:Lipoprotein n=1 Tax=Amycolatopsis minnesotensis TaxID=337894 RepID=A0ABN2R2W3_9PSEU